MTQKQLWTLAGALLGSALILITLLLFQGSDGAEPASTTIPTPTSTTAPKPNPYAWPEPTTDPWPVPAKTFGTKEQVLTAVVAALMDPKGVRYLDLAGTSCRHEQPYQAFRMAFDSDWRRAPIPNDTGLPHVGYQDYPQIISSATAPLEVKWSLAYQGRGVRGDETHIALVTWPTKPEVESVRRVQLGFSFYSPDPARGSWCFRGLGGGMVFGR